MLVVSSSAQARCPCLPTCCWRCCSSCARCWTLLPAPPQRPPPPPLAAAACEQPRPWRWASPPCLWPQPQPAALLAPRGSPCCGRCQMWRGWWLQRHCCLKTRIQRWVGLQCVLLLRPNRRPRTHLGRCACLPVAPLHFAALPRAPCSVQVVKKAAGALGYLCFGHSGQPAAASPGSEPAAAGTEPAGTAAEGAAGTAPAATAATPSSSSGANGVLQPAVTALLALRANKNEEVLFAVGEALCFCFGGASCASCCPCRSAPFCNRQLRQHHARL